MEKQGIITGIGNKITPEIDAVINDFVVHSNTLIRGLQLTVYPQHYYLSAGMCQLCGYRGVLLENIDFIDAPYIYGKFVINFDESVPDSFSIFFAYDTNDTNDGIVNPAAITQAGVYYLLLYSNGVKEVDDFHYPLWAETAEESYVLFDYGVIAETATTPTAPINDNSERVANTEYVHNQIVAEIDDFSKTYTYNYSWSSLNGTISMTIYHRARYVIIKGKSIITSGNAGGMVNGSGYVVLFTVSEAKPTKEIYLGTVKCGYSKSGTSASTKTVDVYINTSGKVCIGRSGSFPNNVNTLGGISINENNTLSDIGYEI